MSDTSLVTKRRLNDFGVEFLRMLRAEDILDLKTKIDNIYDILINGGTIAYIDAETELGEPLQTESGAVLEFNVLVPTSEVDVDNDGQAESIIDDSDITDIVDNMYNN